MKKISAIIALISGFIASHPNMAKAALTGAGIASAIDVKAQGITTYRIGNYYYWYVLGGGLDPTTGAPIVDQMSKDTLWFHHNTIIFDTLSNHLTPAFGSSKMLSLGASGKLAATSFSTISLPFNQLTGVPSMLTGVTASTGISVSNGSVITNISPDKTVTLSGVNGPTVTSSYPSFTVTTKRVDKYTGVTDSSGNYTLTFAQAFAAEPDLQPTWKNSADNQNLRANWSASGFTITARAINSLLGLVPTYSSVPGATISVLVSER